MLLLLIGIANGKICRLKAVIHIYNRELSINLLILYDSSDSSDSL
jgi:hypothetical protein